jgi:beta-phosphoglucomutase-like phosphatase (HAD superfamily)
MPTGSFSHTAPRITDEQEAAERLELSHEEREKVVKDLFGGDPNSLPAEEQFLPELVARMTDAVELIDDLEKREYLLALQLCPSLVASESDAVRFLRSEEYDPEVRE